MLLLVDHRRVVHDKQDLTFISKHSLKTNIEKPTRSDVVRLVRNLNVDLYSTDIESITKIPGGFHITISRYCLIHYGSFKIKYREYANEG